MIHKLLCKLGIHQWINSQHEYNDKWWHYRKCVCCNKAQTANPMHVIWEDV